MAPQGQLRFPLQNATRQTAEKAGQWAAEPYAPSLSVVIATRDRPDTLLRALRSIAAQTRSADEVVI